MLEWKTNSGGSLTGPAGVEVGGALSSTGSQMRREISALRCCISPSPAEKRARQNTPRAGGEVAEAPYDATVRVIHGAPPSELGLKVPRKNVQVLLGNQHGSSCLVFFFPSSSPSRCPRPSLFYAKHSGRAAEAGPLSAGPRHKPKQPR